MLGLRKILSTLFLLVSFGVLILFANNIYNSDKSKDDDVSKKVVESEPVQKSLSAVTNVVDFSTKLSSQNIETNNNFGKKIVDLMNQINWTVFFEKIRDNKIIFSHSATSSISEIKEFSGPIIATTSSTSSDSSGFVNKFTNLLKDKWDKQQEFDTSSLESAVLGEASVEAASKFIDYQKTNEGAEIILKIENGEEFIIPLPFKFLSNNN